MLTEDEKRQIEKSKTDPQCFEPLYLKYHEQILKFVHKRMVSFDDSMEVTSVVFTKALTNIKKYTDQGFPFSSWLYRIAINEINQFYRDTNKTRAISLDERGMKNIAGEAEVEQTELIAALKKALHYLSEEELMLIELRYFEEHTFAEIGQLLGISEGNAKIRTYRVLDKLKGVYAKVS